MASEGKQWVNTYGLEDPVLRVKSRLLSLMGNTLPSVSLRPIQEPLIDDALTAAKARGDVGIILEVSTRSWSVGNPFKSLSTYQYWGQARLVDATEAKIIWQGICKFQDDESKENYTQDQLKADNAAILKAKIAEVADSCADQLFEQFSSKPGVPKTGTTSEGGSSTKTAPASP